MKEFLIIFPDQNIEIKAYLMSEKAPITCDGFWEAIKNPIEILGQHAMYTGREISTQLPESLCDKGLLDNPTSENLTCFPLPGELLFMFMSKYSFEGNPFPIYDIGIFYGRNARTFFPMGWLPGNLFARVANEHEQYKLLEIGQYINCYGQQKVIFKRVEK